jgi:hypothetical protein
VTGPRGPPTSYHPDDTTNKDHFETTKKQTTKTQKNKDRFETPQTKQSTKTQTTRITFKQQQQQIE